MEYENKNGIWCRSDTTDLKVVDEIYKRKVYEKPSLGFVIEPTDVWLDCGCNIGTFSLYARRKGARTIAYEPEPDNIQMCHRNGITDVQPFGLAVTGGQVDLYMAKSRQDRYTHTICKRRGRPTIQITVVPFDSVISNREITAVKMDIEGAEITILESQVDWYNIKKLVVEYSFNVDPSIPRFLAIIDKLKQTFSMVHYTKVKPTEQYYTYFPRQCMIYCSRK